MKVFVCLLALLSCGHAGFLGSSFGGGHNVGYGLGYGGGHGVEHDVGHGVGHAVGHGVGHDVGHGVAHGVGHGKTQIKLIKIKDITPHHHSDNAGGAYAHAYASSHAGGPVEKVVKVIHNHNHNHHHHGHFKIIKEHVGGYHTPSSLGSGYLPSSGAGFSSPSAHGTEVITKWL